MFKKLDSLLRKTILVVGGAVVIYKIIEDARDEEQRAGESGDGYEDPEFDDIW